MDLSRQAMVKGNLKGRRVYITGAGSGIGRSLAWEFLSRGNQVLAIDIRPEALEELRDQAAKRSMILETLAVDVSDRHPFLSALEAACAGFGPPEVMVNNAGVANVGAFLDGGVDSFEQILKVNFHGVLYGTYFALSKMREAKGGWIVNTSSMAGQVPAPFMASYCASKFAVAGFTRALGAEFAMAHSPIRLCLVMPGFVDTPIMEQPGARFPKFLNWTRSTPEAVARSIVRGLEQGKTEIYPDPSSRALRLLYWISPAWTIRSSRLILARSFPQLCGMHPIKVSL